MPAFALLLGGDLHGIQVPRDSPCANSFAIHLLDSGDDSLLTLVVYGLAADQS